MTGPTWTAPCSGLWQITAGPDGITAQLHEAPPVHYQAPPEDVATGCWSRRCEHCGHLLISALGPVISGTHLCLPRRAVVVWPP